MSANSTGCPCEDMLPRCKVYHSYLIHPFLDICPLARLATCLSVLPCEVLFGSFLGPGTSCSATGLSVDSPHGLTLCFPAQLIMEVVQQLSRMFQPDFRLIKKRIEDLISRDYLERDADAQNTYRYLA